MAISEVTICNMALGHLGNSQRIGALTDLNPAAKLCNIWYATLRDATLRDIDWPFARAIVDLGLVEEDPNDDYAFSYRYPSDCLCIRRFVTGNRRETARPVFEIGSDDDGKLIFCDVEEAQVKYTRRYTDAGRFAPDFAIALSWRIAFNLAMPISSTPALRQQAAEQYNFEISKAIAASAEEGQADPDIEGEYIRARS
jgi:hypothetical protein